jgi:hypothetical protein
MSFVSIYFQYTHLASLELTALRNAASVFGGNIKLISAKKAIAYDAPISFGKLLVMTVQQDNFDMQRLNTLLTQFKMLRLVCINSDLFVMSPSLYEFYAQHSLQKTLYYNRLCLSTSLSSIRILLFKYRYFLLSVLILFQENILYKNNLQYIC